MSRPQSKSWEVVSKAGKASLSSAQGVGLGGPGRVLPAFATAGPSKQIRLSGWVDLAKARHHHMQAVGAGGDASPLAQVDSVVRSAHVKAPRKLRAGVMLRWHFGPLISCLWPERLEPPAQHRRMVALLLGLEQEGQHHNETGQRDEHTQDDEMTSLQHARMHARTHASSRITFCFCLHHGPRSLLLPLLSYYPVLWTAVSYFIGAPTIVV